MNVIVLTATLGRSPYLAGTIEGVRALRLDLRHVIVCPTHAVEGVRTTAPHATIVPLDQPAGLYPALNHGLSQVRGWDWFTYLNDDDGLRHGFADVVRQHCHPAHVRSIAYGDVRFLDHDGNDLGRLPHSRDPRSFDALLQAGIPPLFQQGTLMSAEAFREVGGFDTRLVHAADLDLFARAVRAGHRLQYYAADVARFRLQPGQLSSDRALVRQEVDAMRRAQQSASPVSPARVVSARWRFRLANLPCYWERWRLTGLVRTSALLAKYQAPPSAGRP